MDEAASPNQGGHSGRPRRLTTAQLGALLHEATACATGIGAALADKHASGWLYRHPGDGLRG